VYGNDVTVSLSKEKWLWSSVTTDYGKF
jgi:hypothetical protein